MNENTIKELETLDDFLIFKEILVDRRTNEPTNKWNGPHIVLLRRGVIDTLNVTWHNRETLR